MASLHVGVYVIGSRFCHVTFPRVFLQWLLAFDTLCKLLCTLAINILLFFFLFPLFNTYCVNFPENGLIMVLWAGQHLSSEFITNVFGVSSFAQIDTNMVCPLIITTSSYVIR